MRFAVYSPLLISVVLVPIARRVARSIRPSAAAWTLLVSAVAVAAACTGSLLLLAWPLAARIPQLATFGPWRTGDVGHADPVPLLVSVIALGALLTIAGRLVARLGNVVVQQRELRRTHLALSRAGTDQVVVVDDHLPMAYSVAGTWGNPARIVITSSMHDVLDEPERRAVLAHERAHLDGHHRRFVVLTDFALAVNPLLASVRGDLAFILERWADEDAAHTAGRTVTMRALGRAALAHLASAAACPPSPLLHVHGASVAHRVQALMEPPPVRRWPAATIGALVAGAVLAVAWSAHDTERIFEALRAAALR